MFPESGNWHVDLKIAHKKLKYVAVKLIILTLHSNLSWSISIMQYCDTQLIVIFNYVFSPFSLHYIFKKKHLKANSLYMLFYENSLLFIDSIWHYYILVDRCQILLFISKYESNPTLKPWKTVHYAIALSYIN